MEVFENNLERLFAALIEGVSNRLNPKSLSQYQNVCNRIKMFAAAEGKDTYSSELLERYLANIDEQLKNGDICHAYHRFQKRVVRMTRSLAETGEIDFLCAQNQVDKYPLNVENIQLVDAILDESGISERTKVDLRAPMRHLFWYAGQLGRDIGSIDDELIMKFIVEEIPKSNSGSNHRTMRCVRYATTYLRDHGISPVYHDYSMLKLKSPHITIIPAYTEDEISQITAAIDTTTPIGLRDKAIILLGCGCGLRAGDISGLKLANIDWRGQKLSIVQSKTHKPITVVAGAEVMNALADYVLKARPKCEVPEVFVTVHAPYRRLKKNFEQRIDIYCAKAGVSKIAKRHFHSLRRFFATTLVSQGVPLETMSQMLGHKSILEDKPYVTHDSKKIAFVAMYFSDVPLRHGVYASLGLVGSLAEKGGAL